MPPHRRVLSWLRTADSTVPRAARAARRELARLRARRRSGSITAHMEAVVAQANAGTVGPPLPERHRPRRR